MTTKTTPLAVSSLHVKNFKAIRDSGTIQLTPLTVFIGNNGVGKSSLVEALETVQIMAWNGLDAAIDERWRGFEYISNQAVTHEHNLGKQESSKSVAPISFQIEGHAQANKVGGDEYKYYAFSEIMAALPNSVYYSREELTYLSAGRASRRIIRSTNGDITVTEQDRESEELIIGNKDNTSILVIESAISRWHIARLNPESMMLPARQRRVGVPNFIDSDGANLAGVIELLYTTYPKILLGIIETLQFILPYVEDLKPVLTSDIGRDVFLQLREKGFNIPSWLFSTGTLRLLALLVILRSPMPAPLIAIEEIENGLDPRTISLIVDEIREVVRSGRSQIIITTHSPYLLDLLPLESIVFVERIDGEPRFFRPQDDESVQRWSEEFAPGRLYTMGRFRHAS